MTEVFIENNQEQTEITAEIEEVINKSVLEVLKSEECDFDCEVSVTIVTSDEIRALNKEHRGKDSVTDVLSFPILEFDEEGNIISSEFDFDDEMVVLGDIVICEERAKNQAEEYGHSFKREIAFLTVHSMLHLLGYDHEDNINMEQIMFKKQKDILNNMKITRD